MARLFPLRSETQTAEGQSRVVGLEDEDADAVFGALSSTTARRIYGHLAEEPATPSDVAEAVDTSIQNVRYHLEKLEEAGLIEIVDTWYSSRGNEMSVYAASDGPLVVAADRSRGDRLREALSRYLGGITVLAGASLFVQYGIDRLISAVGSMWPGGGGGEDAEPEAVGVDDGDEPDAADSDDDVSDTDSAKEPDVAEEAADEPAEPDAIEEEEAADDRDEADEVDTAETDTPTEEPAETPTETPVDHAPEATDALHGTLPPGLIFFLCGLLVLTLVTVWWYHRPY